MRIIDKFNFILRSKIKSKSILFGQNITTGSRIAGMTNNIESIKKIEIINTQNSESSLIGFGLGLMISKINSIYFAKQLDFILLGIDHIVNTFNLFANKKKKSSFSIITYIVDSGFEGPQSRLNCLSEFASISKARCKYLVFPDDIKFNLKFLSKGGLNLMCLSQRYSRENHNPKAIYKEKNGDYFKYSSGNQFTFIAMGFAAYEVSKIIKNNKKFQNVDFFVITNPCNIKFVDFLKSSIKTKNVYLFDQSKSQLKSLSELENSIRSLKQKISIKKFYRKDTLQDLYANADNYKIKIK